jgi:hypothetical protein
VPKLPDHGIVALWFGYNAGSLTLVGAEPDVLETNFCRQNLGQFAYCNAPAFFAVAGFDALIRKLQVPALGNGKDGRLCPSVRSFAEIDQDQSDNVTSTYLVTPAELWHKILRPTWQNSLRRHRSRIPATIV